MKIGKVIGRITLSKKDSALEGARLLIISPMGSAQISGAVKAQISKTANLVAYDNLGAKEGDKIGYVEGGEASVGFGRPIPIDARCVAIFDKLNYNFKKI